MQAGRSLARNIDRARAVNPYAGNPTLTSSTNASQLLRRTKKAAEAGGLSCCSVAVVYSAACLRGGSSAPESWISAT
jgi:hypothetical protein